MLESFFNKVAGLTYFEEHLRLRKDNTIAHTVDIIESHVTIPLPFTLKFQQNMTSVSKPEKKVYNCKTNNPIQQETLAFHDNSI